MGAIVDLHEIATIASDREMREEENEKRKKKTGEISNSYKRTEFCWNGKKSRNESDC